MKPAYQFRPQGAPAGAWHHTPWWFCTFYDPYERINVWTHGLPALGFILLGVLSKHGFVTGGLPLTVFCLCTAVTHFSSALTHVWPDDHLLEKIDHLCIPFTIIGVPLSAVMALRPQGPYHVMWGVTLLLVAAAFLRPLYRTLGFVGGGAVLFLYYYWIVDLNMVLQVVLQLAGGYFFVRNGGHDRPIGLQDHHFLHYCVTTASILHVFYIQKAMAAPGRLKAA
ncbi:hypothetical protein HYH03_004161 [Edaphochlamys debaryana]|uniref:Uncharacterized protein n=1 Tax=Edaphochlamys debaryana TaxID=47281 RepID=A0A835Y7V8_9CHLO|nr:hypothetical protein HYH03_004161 [Edaphochlamys debaryana]|eukprot:KAG2497895.1 hypothetical protein HYH03_004161 [Edaphochlamys debaryana]